MPVFPGCQIAWAFRNGSDPRIAGILRTTPSRLSVEVLTRSASVTAVWNAPDLWPGFQRGLAVCMSRTAMDTNRSRLPITNDMHARQ